MNYEKTKELINNIVTNEFYHVQNQGLEGMDEFEEYEKIGEEISKMQDQLLKALPEEYHYLVDKLDSKMHEEFAIERRHYFKKGIAAGTSNLNFVGDLTAGVVFY